MKKVFCDCCGMDIPQEILYGNGNNRIHEFNYLEDLRPDRQGHRTHVFDLCYECKLQVDDAAYAKFKEIQKRTQVRDHDNITDMPVRIGFPSDRGYGDTRPECSDVAGQIIDSVNLLAELDDRTLNIEKCVYYPSGGLFPHEFYDGARAALNGLVEWVKGSKK
jgi:hypothetical protein